MIILRSFAAGRLFSTVDLLKNLTNFRIRDIVSSKFSRIKVPRRHCRRRSRRRYYTNFHQNFRSLNPNYY